VLFMWMGGFAPACVHAQQSPAAAAAPQQGMPAADMNGVRILVLDVELDVSDPQQTMILANRMREQIQSLGKFEVVTRQELEQVRIGHPATPPDCGLPQCSLSLAKGVPTPQVVSVHIVHSSDRLWRVTASLSDLPTGDMVRSVTFEHQGNFESFRDFGTRDLAEALLRGGAPRIGRMTPGTEPIEPQPEPASASGAAPAQAPKWVWWVLWVLCGWAGGTCHAPTFSD